MEAVDTTAKDVMAAAATDTTAVRGHDGGGLAGGGRDDDYVAAVSATDYSACRARHRRAVSDSQAG